jgi:hypothetical protein
MADMKRDEIDRVLDAALAKYASAEPRQGLDERVLANLRAEQARLPDRAWWRWSVMAALAGLVVVAVTLTWRTARPSHAVVAHRSPTTTPNLEHPAPRVASGAGPNDIHPQTPGRATRRATHRNHQAIVASPNPKLDQFPSRQQLSEQELALARYVSEFPQEATLIARAQEEDEKEIQQLMKDARSETEGYDTDQQER